MKINTLSAGPTIKEHDNVITIWGELSDTDCKYSFMIVRILQGKIQAIDYSLVDKSRIGRVSFSNLDASKYFYQIAIVNTDNLSNTFINDENIWIKSELFSLDLSTKNFSVIFGSCRRYISFFGLPLFGTGKEGDKIFDSIYKHKPNLFLSIGDQVYYDPIGEFSRIKSYKGMRKLNKKMKSYNGIKTLMANTVSCEICDDHDIHKNNTNSIEQYLDSTTFNNAKRVYYEYQHYDGNVKNPLWYIVNKSLPKYNVSFFIMDVRTERDDTCFQKRHKEIISKQQMEQIKMWLVDNVSSLKFLVSSCPVLSQKENDSWYGYVEQQKELLNCLAQETNVYILTGDAHCARIGTYEIIDKSSIDPLLKKFYLTEILSSGLVAVNHDKGKEYNDFTDLSGYDVDNDFPHTIESEQEDGITIRTTFASKSFPSSNKPVGFSKIKNVFTRVVDNVYTKLVFNSNSFNVEIYNQDSDLLLEKMFEVYNL